MAHDDEPCLERVHGKRTVVFVRHDGKNHEREQEKFGECKNFRAGDRRTEAFQELLHLEQ